MPTLLYQGEDLCYYLSSDPNILDSKNMWWQVLHILLRYSYLIPLIYIFFFRLSYSWMFYWHWNVWRYWLHISFWHTTKYAISCLHTSDWLTWQISCLGRKHIKIALHAAVVFNRNIIQLTQVFFRRFFSFHLILNLLGFWQVHKSSQKLQLVSSLCWLCQKSFILRSLVMGKQASN